jgi:hypothetical protein
LRRRLLVTIISLCLTCSPARALGEHPESIEPSASPAVLAGEHLADSNTVEQNHSASESSISNDGGSAVGMGKAKSSALRDAAKAPSIGDAAKSPSTGDAAKAPSIGDAANSPSTGDAAKLPGTGDGVHAQVDRQGDAKDVASDSQKSVAKNNEPVSGMKKWAAFGTGFVLGTPVAMVRRTISQDVVGAEEMPVIGKSKNRVKVWTVRAVLLPVCAIGGLVQGPMYSLEQSKKFSSTAPFSKDNFSLGHMDSDW